MLDARLTDVNLLRLRGCLFGPLLRYPLQTARGGGTKVQMAFDQVREKVLATSNEFLKQTTTLSTGSIVLLSSLMDKFTSKASVRLPLKLALVAFAASTLISLMTFLIGGPLAHVREDSPVDSKLGPYYLLGIISAFGTFLVGIISLVIFGCCNF